MARQASLKKDEKVLDTSGRHCRMGGLSLVKFRELFNNQVR
jgi:hypothetical protein